MNSFSGKSKLTNSVASLVGTLALVMIASAVVLGTTQNFSVPDDVALRIRLDDTLTSVDSEVGDPFSATVVDKGDYQNARVYGHVAQIDLSGKIKGRARLIASNEKEPSTLSIFVLRNLSVDILPLRTTVCPTSR